MVLGKRWLFLIGNGAEIRPLEMGRKGPADMQLVIIGDHQQPCGHTMYLTQAIGDWSIRITQAQWKQLSFFLSRLSIH